MKTLSLQKASSNTMETISDVKSALHQYVVETEDFEILNQVKEYFRKALKKKGEIIGYTSEGKPLDIKAYKRNIDEARKQAKEGRVISQEELEKASENW